MCKDWPKEDRIEAIARSHGDGEHYQYFDKNGNAMNKLTSDAINWCGTATIAIVDSSSGETTQYTSEPPYKPDPSRYYIVEREMESRMTVVDAVNHYKGEYTPAVALHDAIVYNQHLGWGFSIHGHCGSIEVCTIEEFDSCTKEMAEAKWLNDGEPLNYEGYKQAYKDMLADNALDVILDVLFDQAKANNQDPHEKAKKLYNLIHKNWPGSLISWEELPKPHQLMYTKVAAQITFKGDA